MHRAWRIALVIAIGGVGAFGYFYLFDMRADDAVTDAAYSSSLRDDAGYSESENNRSSKNSSATEVTTPPMAVDAQEKLTADIESDDPSRRAKAIATLAFAPKIKALPVLQKVLGSGDDADRMRALDAMRALALQQGDADGAIRDVLRLTIYDGDDQGVANAQAILEEVEQGLVQTVPHSGS